MCPVSFTRCRSEQLSTLCGRLACSGSMSDRLGECLNTKTAVRRFWNEKRNFLRGRP